MIDRDIQKITSFYGPRGNLFHKGVDLRSVDVESKTYKRQAVTLPIDGKLLRNVFQPEWGYTSVFKIKSSHGDNFVIKFTHLSKPLIEKRLFKYKKGTVIGYTTVTDYMKDNEYWEHLHFELWNEDETEHFNPTIFFDQEGIKYE